MSQLNAFHCLGVLSRGPGSSSFLAVQICTQQSSSDLPVGEKTVWLNPLLVKHTSAQVATMWVTIYRLVTTVQGLPNIPTCMRTCSCKSPLKSLHSVPELLRPDCPARVDSFNVDKGSSAVLSQHHRYYRSQLPLFIASVYMLVLVVVSNIL